MKIGEMSRERRRWKKNKIAARMQRISAAHALRLDQQNLIPEEERAKKFVEPKQRSASGRVFTGNDCEYIRLSSVTANEGCLDGE